MHSTRPSPRPPSAADAMRRPLPYLTPLLLVAAGVGVLTMVSGGGKEADKQAQKQEDQKKQDEKKKDEDKQEEIADVKKLPPAEGDDKEVIETLRKFGGAQIEQDEKAPGKPVVRVSMRGNLFGDEQVAVLKGLKGIKTLDLAFTGISDKALDTVKELTTLTSLSLDRTRVGDAGLQKIADLTKLESLSLGACQVTDKAGDVLAKFTALRSLRLDSAS